MARSLILLVALLLIPAPAVTGQATWLPWITDESGDALAGPGAMRHPDPAADLTGVEVRLEGDRLHIRLDTRDVAPLEPASVDPSYQSHVRFTANGGAAGQATVTIDAGLAGFDILVDGEALPATAWGVQSGSAAWDYEIWLAIEALLPSWNGASIQLLDGHAETTSALFGTTDEAEGHVVVVNGLVKEYWASETELLPTGWKETEGPDLAGGASIAMDDAGFAHVAYYVYDGERGTNVGLYHAKVTDGSWNAKRVGPFSPLQDQRDGATRTEIAVDPAGVHILYNQCPGQACTDPWLYVGPGSEGTEPVQASSTLASGLHDAAALAVGGDRLLVAVPTQDGGLEVLERTDGGWTTLHEEAEARLPRLQVDADDVHLAFVRASPESDRDTESDLYYTSEARAWEPIRLVTDLDDRSTFWGIETDGGYDMALDPTGRPAFAWSRSDFRDPSLPENGFGLLYGDALQVEPAPLKPSHGNPQPAIRLAFDASGVAHIGSGYGGTDGYAIRLPGGSWAAMDLDRYDVWDMAVSPKGLPAFAYTQPHGGTTAAVSLPTGIPASETIPAAQPQGLDIVVIASNLGLVVLSLAALAGVGVIVYVGLRPQRPRQGQP
ncbi:MAG: hypothetical protein ACPGQL_05330 [Thermoplasmatota archaeon]